MRCLVITGGSAGIGLSTAERFSERWLALPGGLNFWRLDPETGEVWQRMGDIGRLIHPVGSA